MKQSDQDPQCFSLIENANNWNATGKQDDTLGGVKYIKIFSMTRVYRLCTGNPKWLLWQPM